MNKIEIVPAKTKEDCEILIMLGAELGMTDREETAPEGMCILQEFSRAVSRSSSRNASSARAPTLMMMMSFPDFSTSFA